MTPEHLVGAGGGGSGPIANASACTPRQLLNLWSADMSTRAGPSHVAAFRRYILNSDGYRAGDGECPGLAALKNVFRRDHITSYMSRLVRANWNPSTINQVVHAIRSFARFAAEVGCISRADLSEILSYTKTLRVREADASKVRRALTGAEVRLLIESTRMSSQTRGGMNGARRALLYHLAVVSGQRRATLLNCRCQDFSIDRNQNQKSPGFLMWHCNPRFNKAGKRITVPLPLSDQNTARLAALIAERTNDGAADTYIFSRSARTSELLAEDLRDAGIPLRTAEGEVDFHSLRVTAATLMARSGVPVTVAQKILGHSNVNITSNIYSRATASDVSNAIRAVTASLATPPPGGPGSPIVSAFRCASREMSLEDLDECARIIESERSGRANPAN